jgi:elongation factor Ts
MAITPAQIKELRERTLAGMSDCKAALVEADGDLEKAVELILKKGIVKAAARAGKTAAEGEVRALVEGKRGTIVEVNCQTDFVSRGDDFKTFVGDVLKVASKLAPGTDLASQKYPGTSKTVDEVRNEKIAQSGENHVIRRWDALEANEPGAIVHSYIHTTSGGEGGKLGVLLLAFAPSDDKTKDPEFHKFVDDVAMQIAAMNPLVVARDAISAKDVEKQKEIFLAQMAEEKAAGTLKAPEAQWPKIALGKLNKWFTEVTLLGQESVVTPGSSVDKLRQELGKKLGGEVRLARFVRFGVGEGIEKKTDDLAAEVAKMV